MHGVLIARTPGWSFDPGLYELLLLAGGLVVLIGAVALSVQRGRPFSAALFYLTAGVLIGLVLRAVGINWYDPIDDAVIFGRAAEVAPHRNRREPRAGCRSPVRDLERR